MDDQDISPKAVCISDIHFSLSTLDLASSALIQARDKAEELDVPLIIAGDLNDTKALLRGEVTNRLIEIFSYSDNPNNTKILIGNHDLLNEKGDAHSLNFLAPYAEIIKSPVFDRKLNLWLIPYQNSQDKLKNVLAGISKGSTLIMHQGVLGADMGHYVKDSTSLSCDAFADFRVISGHYHKAQDIKCGRPRKGAVGLFSYIGSPYTISFSEAADGPKGFRVLYTNGILESIPTNLRTHTIVEMKYTQDLPVGVIVSILKGYTFLKEDLLWIKLTAPASTLAKVSKKALASALPMGENFKLDKITLDLEDAKPQDRTLSDAELLDSLVDRLSESAAQKNTLKTLWRELLEST